MITMIMTKKKNDDKAVMRTAILPVLISLSGQADSNPNR